MDRSIDQIRKIESEKSLKEIREHLQDKRMTYRDLTDEQIHQICQMYEANPRISFDLIASTISPDCTKWLIMDIIYGGVRPDISQQYYLPIKKPTPKDSNDQPLPTFTKKKKHNLIPDEQIHQICKMYEENPQVSFEEIKQAVNPNNLNHGMVRDIISGKSRKDITQHYPSILLKIIKPSLVTGNRQLDDCIRHIVNTNNSKSWLFRNNPDGFLEYIRKHHPGVRVSKALISEVIKNHPSK